MFPATNAGAGGNVGFPDVCLTPAAPSPVPVPYPNTSTNAQSVGFCANIMATGVPLNNMASKQAMTNGMNAGAAHPPGIMKPGGYNMGNPMIQANGLPAQNLLLPTNGNGYNNPMGATLIPSATNVFFCSPTAAALPATDVADPWARPVNGDELAALGAQLGEADDRSVGFTPAVSRDEATGALRVTVVHVRRRTLASTAGVQAGDELLAVNGWRVATGTADELATRLQIDAGADLTFTVRRDGTVIGLRGTQPAPERRAAIANDRVVDGCGRIEILRFVDDLPRQLATAIRRLTAAGATRLELDLRDCPGGELESALRLADDFLPAGLELATVTDANGHAVTHRTRRAPRHDLPLTLRVNRGTASAAEVFVHALARHARADVGGGPMMGKLAVQQLDPRTSRIATTATLAFD